MAGFIVPLSVDAVFGLQLRFVLGTPFDFDGERWGSFDVQLSLFFFSTDIGSIPL